MSASVLSRDTCASGLREAGIAVPAGDSPIVPVILGENDRAVAVAAALQQAGFDVRAIRPPTVPPGTARLRISVNVSLSEDILDSLRGQNCARPLRNRDRHRRRQDRALGRADAALSRRLLLEADPDRTVMTTPPKCGGSRAARCSMRASACPIRCRRILAARRAGITHRSSVSHADPRRASTLSKAPEAFWFRSTTRKSWPT